MTCRPNIAGMLLAPGRTGLTISWEPLPLTSSQAWQHPHGPPPSPARPRVWEGSWPDSAAASPSPSLCERGLAHLLSAISEHLRGGGGASVLETRAGEGHPTTPAPPGCCAAVRDGGAAEKWTLTRTQNRADGGPLGPRPRAAGEHGGGGTVKLLFGDLGQGGVRMSLQRGKNTCHIF